MASVFVDLPTLIVAASVSGLGRSQHIRNSVTATVMLITIAARGFWVSMRQIVELKESWQTYGAGLSSLGAGGRDQEVPE
jgi:hypothetical protein